MVYSIFLKKIKTNDNVDVPYFSLEEGVQSGNTKLFFTGPYTVYNVAYKVVNNDGTISIEPNGNEPLTFYVKVNQETGEVSSLFEILNTPSSEFIDDDIYNNYFKTNVKEAKENKKLKFDIKTVEDNEYQPNHMNETRNVGGFYNTSFAVGIADEKNNISGKLYDKDGNDITNEMIDSYLATNAINKSDITSIDQIDEIKSNTDINSYVDNFGQDIYAIEISSGQKITSLIPLLNANVLTLSGNEFSSMELKINNENIISGNTIPNDIGQIIKCKIDRNTLNLIRRNKWI